MPTLIGNSSLMPWTCQWPLLLSKVLWHHIEKLWHHISRQAYSDVLTNPSFIVLVRLPRTTWEMRQREVFSLLFWCILFNVGLCHCQHLAFLQYCTVFLIYSCMRKGRVSNQGLFILPWTFLSLPNHTTFQNLGYYEKFKCRCLHLLLK